MMDFTAQLYNRLLSVIKETGYQMVTVREYITQESLPEKYLIMRHDVDRKPDKALRMAHMEANHGFSSTYYFRAIDKTFKSDIIEEIAELGHEVGYHYEDVDVADGDLDEAQKSFTRNLRRFRELTTVETVSMHGNPLTSHDNRDLWDVASFEEFDLFGEVYLTIDFEEVAYFSDTNRTWTEERTIVNDWPVGPAMPTPDDIESTEDLISLIESQQLPKIYLLVHPNRWAWSVPEWVSEFTKDTIINTGKWGLWTFRTMRHAIANARK